MEFLFTLGRKAELNHAELTRVCQARFSNATITPWGEHHVCVTGISEADVQMLQDLLGGVVKVALILERRSDKSVNLVDVVARHLDQVATPGKQLKFGIGEIGRDHKDRVDARDVKEALKGYGRKSRYVEGPRGGLSASVLLHQDVRELTILESPDEMIIAHTIGIQNIDDWTIRDRHKPAADRKRGMLPPKLARIMVNLAVPAGQGVVYDPFCGTGTTLLEAMMLGMDAVGSDIRSDAVEQTRANLAWFAKTYPEVQAKGFAFMADATTVKKEQFPQAVTAVVAEGYLGPQMPTQKQLPDLFKGIERLYLGSMKHWRKVLSPGTTLCIALPRVDVGNTTYSLASLIDSAGSLGYNTISGPYIYDRPETIVKREIFLLEYQG